MSLTENDKEIIKNTWSMVRVDSTKVGIELFKRFFESNPDYIKLFPFENKNDLNEILKSTTLKQHAGRVMQALSSIVDNLDDCSKFEENLNNILSIHIERNIELKQFENLKLALVNLLLDQLGNDIMNNEAIEAWTKAYNIILITYNQQKQKQ